MGIIYEEGNPSDPSTWHPAVREAWIRAGLLNPDGTPPGSGGGGGGGSSSTSTTNAVQNFNRTTTPFVTEQFGPLLQFLIGAAEQSMRLPQGLPPQYEAQGIQQTNRTFDALQKGLMNRLSAQGSLGSPAGAYPQAVLDTGRGQAIAGFQNSLPMLARQFQNEDFARAAGLTQMFGLGQKEQGRTTTNSTTQGRSTGGGGGGGMPPGMSLAQQVAQYWAQQQQRANQPNWFERYLLPLLGIGVTGLTMFGGGGGGRAPMAAAGGWE